MFGSCCRRLQLLLVPSSVDYSVAHFHCIQNSRSCSSKSLLGSEIIDDDDKPQDGKDLSFTVSYLINSCGLSPELALSLSKKHKKVLFNTRQGPDSVLNLLKHNGFNDTQISQLVRQQPSLLAYNAQKTLLPKLEFLGSIGISGTVLARLLCINPRLLGLSLEKSLRPSYDISKTLRIPKEKLPYFFSNFRGISIRVLSIVAGNISVLRAHDVPESSFPLWQPLYFTALSFDSDKVEANVNKVISMGFHPSHATFMKALSVQIVFSKCLKTPIFEIFEHFKSKAL
ncbi:hypothetical protein M0R45_032079 [Rubus argutus]|uniref:Uncharacterized protein n=1 Tax=Rubus argutus TaxID=59490 RepID=A0AAW1WK20_RUBAR